MKNIGNLIALAALLITILGAAFVFSNKQAVIEAAVQRIDATVAENLAVTKGLEIDVAIIKARFAN
jgi:hypothetical protein